MSGQYGPVRGEFVSYVDAILDVLSAEPRRTVITTADGSQIRAADLRDRVHRLAAELGDRGVGRGTTVALLTGSTAEGLVARYAANLAGGTVVTLYEGTSATTMAAIMASVDCSLLLVDGHRQETGAELAGTAAAFRTLSLGPSTYAEDVLAVADLRPARPLRSLVHPEDDWRIGHTGGTTGIPKGIRMSHGAHRRGLDDRLAGAGDPPRFLACTSLAHLAGLLVDRTLYQHGSVVLQDGFDPGEVLAAVARERITHTWLLPPLLYQLLDHPGLAGTDLRSLSRVTYGGTAASPDRLREAAAVLGPVLYGWYGQAEAQLITEAGPGEQELTGRDGHLTVGRAMPGVEIAIRRPDGTVLPAGEPGEVQARSHHVMRGYCKQPELTAEVLKDGWLHTGDVGYLDEDGRLYIVDRIKEMIVVVGGHVYPADLEELLLRHPAVARCTVFGSSDEHALEQVHAAVVPVAGHRPSLEELRDFVTVHKGALYAPHAVHFVPEIPLTAVGKPDRRMLRSRFARPSAAGAPQAEASLS
ncbi:AMP-binding protein [Streptomyces sp. C]|uniref:AMP-binding protein n=1 Tax=Streptomyces sp. C TaxID=253839 RepID=UPI00068052C2|nr:AMP-binding protein [Streptomyces sp. C]